MRDFGGKLAVITGGGTGMGRELARQLVAEGCDVAMCDVSAENMAQTKTLCEAEAPQGIRISTFVADVSNESQINAFAEDVLASHGRDHINLLFNNAGVGGGGSFLEDDRDAWERTFNICWYGVYYTSRAFMPALVNSSEGHLVNTSSVNGFWASLGPQTPHTAYSAAKFAVKGFTEALINDLRIHAPHVKCSVVMPGHIGTDIAINSGRIVSGKGPEDLTTEELDELKARMSKRGLPVENVSNDQLRQFMTMQGENFRDNAPTSAAEAATVILNGVKSERWRILIGNDAEGLDRLVREAPETAYEPAFMERLKNEASWGLDTL